MENGTIKRKYANPAREKVKKEEQVALEEFKLEVKERAEKRRRQEEDDEPPDYVS